MAARVSIATKARLPSSIRVDSSNPAVTKSLSRLSRESLIGLALDWLDESAIQNASPYLRRAPEGEEDVDEDADDLYPPCPSVQELQSLYEEMRIQKGSKRDAVSRILEGDWRQGMTLYQLAMADFAYLDEHPTSQYWTAYHILPLRMPTQDDPDNEEVLKVDKESLQIPRFHPATFLQNLQEQGLPDVKAHYHFHRPESLPLLLLRIFVVDSPYNSSLALSSVDHSGTTANFDTSRTVYLAFPDGSPWLYISKTQKTGPVVLGDSKGLRDLIVDGVPKALSRPRERFTLKATSLSSRNLWSLLDKKGPGRGNAAGGGWSIYANEKNKKSPIDSIPPTPPLSRDSSEFEHSRKRKAPFGQAERDRKRAKLLAEARFGDSGHVDDGKGVERVEVVLLDPFPPDDTIEESEEEDEEGPEQNKPGKRRKSKVNAVLEQASKDLREDEEEDDESTEWAPSLKVTFSGSHVFAGIRQLVEAGIVDGQRMPGWLTGEEAVTTGVVRHGRIRGHKGSGV